ncbi:MAG: SUMF1/EgtB/PvdO family nonheme iron enzyme, partial [Oscillospiraceae bacterium]|nr:SUMF1/EgtB/PvdO family nonheme iron enzyme [Oscillospiraceae bacterium]
MKLLNKKTGENYRLPTEEEWEYAARGGNRSNRYKFAGNDDLRKVGWYAMNSGKTIREVCQKDSN